MLDIKTRQTKLKLFLFCNIIFAFYLLFYYIGHLNNFIGSVLINLITFIIPGFGWIWLLARRIANLLTLFFCIIFFSTIVLCLGIILRIILNLELIPVIQLALIAVITNIGILVGNYSSLKWHEFNVILLNSFIVFLVVYIFIYIAAVYIVPPMQDDDLDIQGTAYGLLHDFKPMVLTDRLTLFDFSHPPIINFFAAHTILFSDSLYKVKYFYDYAKRAKSESIKLKDLAEEDNSIEDMVKEEYETFYKNPVLFGTRLPQIFFSACCSIALFYLVFYITSSYFLSNLAIILYFSFPELFVGHSMQGHTSISNLCVITMVSLYILNNNYISVTSTKLITFIIGIFAALSNHKLIIFPAAILCNEAILYFKDNRMKIKQFMKIVIANELLQGFMVGTFLFWIYGIFIDRTTFMVDHFQYHLFDRILHRNVLNYVGYPSLFQLWKEFGWGLGWPFFTLSLFSIWYLSKDSYRERSKKLIFAFWIIIGAVTFSIIDWRETYHLFIIVPALVISTMIYITKQSRVVRKILVTMLLFVIIRNAWIIHKLTTNFYIVPSFLRW